VEKAMRTANQFWESRIFLTGAELDLYTLLADTPLTAVEISERIDGFLRPITIILDALAAMGILTKEGDRYRTETSLEPVLSANSPTSILPMVMHLNNLWETWSRLTDIAVHTGVPESSDESRNSPEDMRSFIQAMHVAGQPMATRIASAVQPGAARSLLDVGGATGTYTIAFLQSSPDMKATIFDRPEVVEMADARLVEAGLRDRVTLVGGDFYTDDLPAGHDLALLSAIIHQNSFEQNVDLYRKVLAALEPGGRLVIRDHVMKPNRIEPAMGAIFAVNMLVNNPGGGTFTYEEIEAGLVKAGFAHPRLIQDEQERMDGLVEAFKPLFEKKTTWLKGISETKPTN
jgi:predicted O-methyltransferase YrrM